MANTYKTIHNPVNKQSIRFLQTSKNTDGRLLEMESTYAPHSLEPKQHYHPYQSEDFTVLKGELTIKMAKHVLILKQGETIHIPANTSHSMWNNTAEKTVINWKVYPAMETEHLLETVAGLATDGRISKKGILPFLHVVAMADRYAAMFRLSRPAFALQKTLFFLLKPFAYVAGYKRDHAKYIDQ
jgi:quercetin dioxygenase-like cupin family protein